MRSALKASVSDGLGVVWKAHSSTWSQTLLVMCAWPGSCAWVSFMVSFQLCQFKKGKMVSSLVCLNVIQWNDLGGKGP